MKPGYSRLILGLIILGLSVASCSGGGGSSSSPHAPSLSGFYLYPTSAAQNEGNGTVPVNCSFTFADAGGDLASITVTVYDANGTVLGSDTGAVQGTSGITLGFLSGSIDADTSVPGNYRIEFYATDSAGSRSNTVSSIFTVFPAAPLVSIAVTPTDAQIFKGAEQQFTATGTYADNTVLDITRYVSWGSSSTYVATIDFTGRATGQAAGSTTITATSGGISGSVTLVVADIPLVSVAVTPTDARIVKGATQQFTAWGTYSDNTTRDITGQVSWTSSDPNLAAIDYRGLATGWAGGSATITATLGGISGSTTLTVLADFRPGINYPADSSSFVGNTAIGDLNGDGRNDVAVLEAWGNRVYIYYQNADHTLSSPQVLATGLNVKGIAIADVNNDGFADLIVSGGSVNVYRQDPVSHQLDAGQQYTVSSNACALAVADLNKDGLPDIVVSGAGSGSGVVSFLFQGENGSLSSEVTYTSVAVYAGGELHVADMNNDGLNDIVLQSGEKQLAVIKQVSAGTFSTTPDYYAVQTNYWPYFNSFALGDLNGDGLTDIAVADPTDYLNIFLQNGSGLLTGPTIKSVYSESEVDIADVDGDGLNDVILIDSGYIVQILYQTADHAFPNMVIYSLPTQTEGGTFIHEALSVGDITGDGLPDIVASWSDQGIFVLPHVP